MTQQYIAESMVFQSGAMPHGPSLPLEGADEAWLDKHIHQQIQVARSPRGPSDAQSRRTMLKSPK